MGKVLFLLFILHICIGNICAQSVYLIGDAGKLNIHTHTLFQQLEEETKEKEVSILVLGDNIYGEGLTKENDKQIIDRQLEALISAKGLKLILPGNHDWHDGKEKGLGTIIKQEAYVEAYGDSTIMFSPNAGEPGPEIFHLGDSIVIITIDTQWWLHKHEKNMICSTCSDDLFISTIDSLLQKYSQKQVIVAGHHPLYSKGHHGGHYSFNDHMHPFPLLGSGIILSKWLFPGRQETNNHRFKKLKNVLVRLFDEHGNIIYASGHDHSLQYLPKGQTHYLISGAGSKSTFVKKGKGSEYTYHGYGYMKLEFVEGHRTLKVYSDVGKLLKTIQF